MWRLGGKNSSFKMGPGTTTAYQHDAVVEPDGVLTIFDDGGGPPRVHTYSRGIKVTLNTKTMTATLVKAFNHPPPIAAAFEGGAQALPHGERVRRLGPAALLHGVQRHRSGQLRRALHGPNRQLPRIPIPVERRSRRPRRRWPRAPAQTGPRSFTRAGTARPTWPAGGYSAGPTRRLAGADRRRERNRKFETAIGAQSGNS